jgi:hypothetical protein
MRERNRHLQRTNVGFTFLTWETLNDGGDVERPGSKPDDDERATILSDIRVAEEQIARGEGVEHEMALQQVLARIRPGADHAGPEA